MTHRLTLLGPVCLTGHHRRVSRRASQQRRLALLAIVGSAPSATVSRDRVLGLLWPDRDERAARHLLADSLFILRGALGRDAIISVGETLQLSTEHLGTDIAEFHRALAEGRWADALNLYRGDFLDGFFLRHARDFDEWLTTERARVRTLAARAASMLATQLAQSGEIAAAAAAAERALELEPSHEASARARSLGVAASTAAATLVERAGGSRPRLTRIQAVDATTANIIAQGRHLWHQRTRRAVDRAIVYFTRAVERAPHAVDAWCGLADCWVVMGGRGYVSLVTAVGHAAASADRAIALDDTQSGVHTSLGAVNLLRRRWSDAESALRNAIVLDSQNANAHHFLSLALLSGFGLRDVALEAQSRAASLNPLSPLPVGTLGWQQYLRGDYAQSRSSLEPALDLNADLEEGHVGLARAAARLGDERTVRTSIRAGLVRHGARRGDLLAEQASAFALLGDRRRARALARAATQLRAMPVNLALAWASVGNAEESLTHLMREPFRVYWTPQAVWWDPRLDDLRDDRRFARVLARVQAAWSPEW